MSGIFIFILIMSSIGLWIKLKNQEQEIEFLKFHMYNTDKKSDTVNTQKSDSQQNYPENSNKKNANEPIISTNNTIKNNTNNTPIQTNEQLKTDDGFITQKYESFKNKEKKMPNSFESWFGRNVVGIAASILVFVGLIFLGTLAYKHMPEAIKILSMYAISTLITSLGIVLTIKRRSDFSLILSGCGCGCFFISILLTHIYFDKINDITAFSLLLVWMIITLFIAKKLTSTILSIVAHIGMAVSICFAFAQGLTDDKLLIVLIYQAASIAVILVGNIICCKKTYKFGVFISFILTIIASMYMWNRFEPINHGPFQSSLPTYAIVFAFVTQFLFSSFLSYLLAISTNRLKQENIKLYVHAVNKILWITSLMINIYMVIYRISISGNIIYDSSIHSKGIFIAVLVSLAVILVHTIITLLMSLKLNFNGNLETLSILFLSALSTFLILNLYNTGFFNTINAPNIPYLILLSLVLIFIYKITKNKAYLFSSNIILGIDLVLMLSGGYKSLNDKGTIALSIVYMLLYCAIIFVQWFKQNESIRKKYYILTKLSLFAVTQTSLISILLSSGIEYRKDILLLILTAISILLYLIRYDQNEDNSNLIKSILRVNEIVLILVCAGNIAYAAKDSTQDILYLIIASLALVLSFTRINEVLDGSNNSVLGVLTGLKTTILVLAIVEGYTKWFDQAYIFSIICMLTALACIILGFVGRTKSLRLYGLILTMLCVLKLVTYDVAELNTPLRVFALIGGGTICFIISAIYNYTSKRLLVDEENKDMKSFEL